MKKIELGYGAGAIADYPYHRDGKNWMAEDVKKVLECFSAFEELRISWIDTAWTYGKGESEKLIGQALATKAQKWKGMAVITKIPCETPDGMDWKYAESRTRLGRAPDVLLLHNPDLSKWDELERACRWLVAQKTTWYGISTEPVDEARRAMDLFGLNAIEFPASPWDWRAERVMAQWMGPRKGLIRIANRILGGPQKEKLEGDVKKAAEYIVENREWIDVALIGTINIEHLRGFSKMLRTIEKEIEGNG